MIVIPMAGASRRFAEAGYARPKYELMLDGRCVFDHAVGGFAALFAVEPFLFIVRGEAAADFVRARAADLGVAHAQVASLGAPTAGQAETVSLGLAAAGVAGELGLSFHDEPPVGSSRANSSSEIHVTVCLSAKM